MMMFTTAGLHPRDRFDYWHDVAEREIIGHDSRPGDRDRFCAELRASTLADFDFCAFTTGSMACVRALKHIAGSSTDEFFLCRNGSGQFALEQNGRNDLFDPGDLVLIDSNRRYSIDFTDDSQMLILKIPRRILETRFGEMHDVMGAKLAGAQGANAHLSATLESICSHADQFEAATAEAVRNHLVDLLTHTFGALFGQAKRLSTPRTLALIRLRGVIEARISDPGLDSACAARAAGISVRYANALLEPEGTSLARLIRETRLERCRQALSDPAHDRRTIGEIAFAWGFGNQTNFGRLFQAAYGVTPREYRRSRESEICVKTLVSTNGQPNRQRR